VRRCRSNRKLSKSVYKRLAQKATHSVYKSKLAFGKDWEDGIRSACVKALQSL